ncbi:hypothetical protein [Gordonia insulae]|uniref:Uncharacterized protein n=1 Tax=Gordonia insulae TaxID=2420509 RepID=A0A3G8JUI5_9ACTN|nr:hypothetical protein [Gordonia insulae]AZG48528.1 hypothetical protein D7316_05145 [Gordonia insulae]
MQGVGIWVFFVAVGVVGLTWAIVDIVNVGWGNVPGSTWLCVLMSLIVVVGSLYREFGGAPLVTADDD